TLRYAALGRKRMAESDVVPIRIRAVRPTESPKRHLSARSLWGRAVSILVLFLAMGAVFYISTSLPQSNRILKAAERPITTAKAPAWIELEAIDLGVLSEAVADARAFTVDSSVARLEQHSRRCFSRLERAPSVKMLDY